MSGKLLQSNLNPLNNEKTALVVVAVLYAVGIVGFVFLSDMGFAQLTPLNLMISLLLALRFHSSPSGTFYAAAIFIALAGYLIEVAGVHSGLIFGVYHYGPVLGFSLFNTPLSIGINWLLLVYTSSVLINFLLPQNKSRLLKATVAAALMVGLDVLIEPVAIATDMWHWEAAQVPLQNYVGWFVAALALQYIMSFFTSGERNRVAAIIFLLQMVFFALLNVLL